jgi:hypothetical protein
VRPHKIQEAVDHALCPAEAQLSRQ